MSEINGGQTAIITANITGNGGIVGISLQENTIAGALTISGTFTGTLQFEQSNDGSNWVNITGSPQPSGAGATNATAPGVWSFDLSAMRNFRIRASAFASGTAVVTISTSQVEKIINSGGGTPGGTNGQLQYNNSSAFGGVAGSVVDPTTGAITLSTTSNAVSPESIESVTVINTVTNSPSFADALDLQVINNGTGDIPQVDSLYIIKPALNSGGTITDNYAIFIEDQDVGTNNWAIKTGLGKVQLGDVLQLTPVTFATLPSPAAEGMIVPINNSNVSTFGATITGTGAFHGLAYYDGTNWTFR